jgi:hypothetical protein
MLPTIVKTKELKELKAKRPFLYEMLAHND